MGGKMNNTASHDSQLTSVCYFRCILISLANVWAIAKCAALLAKQLKVRLITCRCCNIPATPITAENHEGGQGVR